MDSCSSGGSGIRHVIRTGVLLAGCCGLHAKTYAQSFDCNKASTAVEKAICDDKQLRELDEVLARDLKAALAAAPDRRRLLLVDQRRWLAYRDKQCRDESPLNSCLIPLYHARVGHLQASASPSAAICQKVADGYRPLASSQPGKTGDNAFIDARPPQYSSEVTFPWTDDPISQLHEWAQAQVPPFVIGQELLNALSRLAEETGTIGTLDKLPGRHFYALTHEQGSARCLTSQFFTVQNGYARPVSEPEILEDSSGASCGASRRFVRIDGIPALVQSKFDRTPSMSATQVIVTWDENLSPSGCALTFSYAPKFGRATFHGAKETCEGPSCDGLRAAARELVEAVQNSPKQTRERLQNRLTEAQRIEYGEAVEPLIRNQGLAREADPAYITDFVPMLLPHVHEGKVYVVSLGHFKPYADIFADWSVKFESFTAGTLVHSATFAVGMERGALEDLSISLQMRP